MAADLTGDTIWYNLGYHFVDPLTLKYGKFFGLTTERANKTKEVFQNHPRKILFLSKITMGLGFPWVTLIVAGMSKMSFKQYITSLFFGQFIFTGVLISVGYFFGNLYVTINKDFKIISVIAFCIVIILITTGIRSYFRNRNLEKII
jgi:membrane protein DedA with SNARE-associated domain